MYTGTMIDDLMAAVERSEGRTPQFVDFTLLEPWPVLAAYELPTYEFPAADFAGVA
jgi:hypothetical protein